MHTHYSRSFPYTLHSGESIRPTLALSEEKTPNTSGVTTASDTRINERLRQMITCGRLTDMNALGLDRLDITRSCEIVRYAPGEADETLAATLSVFVEDKGHTLTDLGLLIHAGDNRVVALHLHREHDGRVIFRYYDPNPDAASREGLKEPICRLLRRYGMDREWHFTGARQIGDKTNAEHGDIHAVLALRDMLAGQPELTATPQDILEWQEQLTLSQPPQTGHAEEPTLFSQALSSRSDHGHQLARQVAEKSEAMSVVLDYFAPRKKAQFQILNKRLYEQILPKAMGQVSFSDFPVKRTPPMVRPFLKDNQVAIEAYLAKTCQNAAATRAIVTLPEKLEVGPFQQFLGWLLLCNALPNSLSDEADTDAWMKVVYAIYRQEKHDPAKIEKIRLSYKLGKLIWPDTFMRGKHWRVMVDKSSQVNGAAGMRIGIVKNENLGIVDLFDDAPKLSDEQKKTIQQLLDRARGNNVITEEESLRARANLEPVYVHLANGKMIVDVFTLPKKEGNQEKSVVYVNCTPLLGFPVKPRQIFEYEDIFLDDEKQNRLSDKLKNDIRVHSKKMGWPEHCLGMSFQPTAAHAQPMSHDNDYVSLFQPLVLSCSQQYGIALDVNTTQQQKRHAWQKLDRLEDQIFHLCTDTLRYIDPGVFSTLVDTLAVTVSIAAFSRFPLALLKAVRLLSSKEAVSTEELQRFRSMLEVYRDRLASGATQRRIVHQHHAIAYPTINALNAAIQECDGKVALRDSIRR